MHVTTANRIFAPNDVDLLNEGNAKKNVAIVCADRCKKDVMKAS